LAGECAPPPGTAGSRRRDRVSKLLRKELPPFSPAKSRKLCGPPVGLVGDSDEGLETAAAAAWSVPIGGTTPNPVATIVLLAAAAAACLVAQS
jgi:hypothetical protein